MHLVVTGGGTGGHVYPALEIARAAGERGMRLTYLGSLRGQEGAACAARGLAFEGFPAEPLYSLKTPRGWRALVQLQRSRGMVKRHMRVDRPDAVFSTGGYSAGPVVAAARDLEVPYIVHSADSVPPRSSAMFARRAFAFTTVFRSTPRFFTEREVVRTGQPIRRELREAALEPKSEGRPHVLVIGGSQGSDFLNRTMPEAAAVGRFSASVLHVSGPKHLESTQARVKSEHYEVVPYLETAEMTSALRRASVVVCRAGGTLAELAVFGIPSVVVPLPNSANGHQQNNALEFEEMAASTTLRQSEDRSIHVPVASIALLADAVAGWLTNGAFRAQARHNLRQWDIPTATDRIVDLIQAAAQSK